MVRSNVKLQKKKSPKFSSSYKMDRRFSHIIVTSECSRLVALYFTYPGTQADGGSAFFSMWYLRSVWNSIPACKKEWGEYGKGRPGLKGLGRGLAVSYITTLPSVKISTMASSNYKEDWETGDIGSHVPTYKCITCEEGKSGFFGQLMALSQYICGLVFYFLM